VLWHTATSLHVPLLVTIRTQMTRLVLPKQSDPDTAPAGQPSGPAKQLQQMVAMADTLSVVSS
jgi:hypothetical protein